MSDSDDLKPSADKPYEFHKFERSVNREALLDKVVQHMGTMRCPTPAHCRGFSTTTVENIHELCGACTARFLVLGPGGFLEAKEHMGDLDPLDFDPVRDDQRGLNIRQFQAVIRAELDEYCQQMAESGRNPCNEEQKKLARTRTDWMNSFRMWASW